MTRQIDIAGTLNLSQAKPAYEQLNLNVERCGYMAKIQRIFAMQSGRAQIQWLPTQAETDF